MLIIIFVLLSPDVMTLESPSAGLLLVLVSEMFFLSCVVASLGCFLTTTTCNIVLVYDKIPTARREHLRNFSDCSFLPTLLVMADPHDNLTLLLLLALSSRLALGGQGRRKEIRLPGADIDILF